MTVRETVEKCDLVLEFLTVSVASEDSSTFSPSAYKNPLAAMPIEPVFSQKEGLSGPKLTSASKESTTQQPLYTFYQGTISQEDEEAPPNLAASYFSRKEVVVIDLGSDDERRNGPISSRPSSPPSNLMSQSQSVLADQDLTPAFHTPMHPRSFTLSESTHIPSSWTDKGQHSLQTYERSNSPVTALLGRISATGDEEDGKVKRKFGQNYEAATHKEESHIQNTKEAVGVKRRRFVSRQRMAADLAFGEAPNINISASSSTLKERSTRDIQKDREKPTNGRKAIGGVFGRSPYLLRATSGRSSARDVGSGGHAEGEPLNNLDMQAPREESEVPTPNRAAKEAAKLLEMFGTRKRK
jgi:hypothetical protein